MAEDRIHVTSGVRLAEVGFAPPQQGAWFVAHTRARHEKQFADELERLQIPQYLPLTTRKTKSRRTGRISHSEVPVFPGYVFFYGEEGQRYRALQTNRVAHVIEVPDQRRLMGELMQVHLLLSRDEGLLTMDRVQVGDWGRITAGPLEGLEGLVTRVAGGCRITMNVTILGQSVSTEVDDSCVERIDPPAWLAAQGA